MTRLVGAASICALRAAGSRRFSRPRNAQRAEQFTLLDYCVSETVIDTVAKRILGYVVFEGD